MKYALWWIVTGMIGSLVACTPSDENSGNQLKVVVAAEVPQTLPSMENCTPPQQGVNKVPGLLVLSFAQIQKVEQGSLAAPCVREKVVPLPEVASDIAAPTLSPERFFVALAKTGVVKVFSNKLVELSTLPLPENYGQLCPSKLVLSPDELRLAVVDDPADATTECLDPADPTKPPRVLIYDLSTPTITTPLVWDTSEQKDKNLKRERGGFAVALTNDASISKNYTLWRFGVETNRYTIARITLPALTSGDSRPLTKPDAPSINPNASDRAALGLTSGSADSPQLLAGLNQPVNFRGFTFVVPTSGDLRELEASGQKIGASDGIVFDPRTSINGTSAFFQGTTGRLGFRQGERLSFISAFAVKDLTWLSSFVFALSETGIVRYDLNNFQPSDRPVSLNGLEIDKARAIAAVTDPEDTVTPMAVPPSR
jgi:hypothetical protein